MSLTAGHDDAVNALSLNESGELLASGGDDACFCIWAPRDRRLVCKIHFSDDVVTALRFCGNNRPDELFAAHGRQLAVWDIRYLTDPVHCWSVSEDEINCIALREPEHRLAVADDQGYVHIIDSESGHVVRSLHKHSNICSAVAFRPNRPWQVVSAGLDCVMVTSDWLGSGQSLGIFNMTELLDDMDFDLLGIPTINPPMIHCLSATEDGQFVACGLESGTVEVFAAGGKNLVHIESLCGHSQAVSCLLSIAQGNCLISGGADGGLYVWQLDSDGQGHSYTHHAKVNHLEGRHLEEIYIANNTDTISICNLAL